MPRTRSGKRAISGSVCPASSSPGRHGEADAKLAGARTQGATLEKDVRAIERKIEQLLDRIVEAEGASLIAAYEKRIRDLETEKALMHERIASCGKPLASFGETYRTAFDFLANPCKLWHSPRLEDRRAVLKLVFAERLPYVRNEGYRTAKISMPFNLPDPSKPAFTPDASHLTVCRARLKHSPQLPPSGSQRRFGK